MYELELPPTRAYVFSGDSKSLMALGRHIAAHLHDYETKVDHDERDEYAILVEEPGYSKACIENCSVEVKYSSYGVYISYARHEGCNGCQTMNANKFIRRFTSAVNGAAEKYQFIRVNNCKRNIPTSCAYVKDYVSDTMTSNNT